MKKEPSALASTPPTDYKKLAKDALANGAECEFDDDILKALARAVLTLDAENKRQSDLRQVAVEMRVRTDKADARLYAENQRLRAALEDVETVRSILTRTITSSSSIDYRNAVVECQSRLTKLRAALERK